MRHGTNNAYVHYRCRCVKCKKAHAKANTPLQHLYEGRLRRLGFEHKWVRLGRDGILTVLSGIRLTAYKRYEQYK